MSMDNARTFLFGMDAFRDNAQSRALLSQAIEALEGGCEISDLDTGELERIAQAAKADGSNAAAVQAGKEAQDEIDNRAERAYEQSKSEYYGGSGPITMRERHQAAWAEHVEAHRR